MHDSDFSTHVSPPSARMLFRRTADGLIAANTGRPFSPSGLEAICSAHVSDKRSAHSEVFSSEAEANAAIKRIRESQLMVYQVSKGKRIDEDAQLELANGRDYSNRVLLELMQNADDAASKRPIGNKGLGFKSILEISDSPRICSGYLRLKFDRSLTCGFLAKQFTNLKEVPALRLPFPGERDGKLAEFAQSEGFDTVIFLPWKKEIDWQEFDQDWDIVSGDATLLLLLNTLGEVRWEAKGAAPIVWRCKRENDIRTLSVNEDPPTRWRIFRHFGTGQDCAVVAQLDENGRPQPCGRGLKEMANTLRVFFPTEEHSPIPMILHGEFEIDSSRKHIHPGGTRQKIMQGLAECVQRVLAEINDDGIFLDSLKPRIPPDDMTGVEKELWGTISAAVRETVLPESQVKLCDVRLCPEYNPDFPWYSDRLNVWKTFKGLLINHRRSKLAGLNLLLPGIDTEEREKKIILFFNPAAHLTIEDLKRLPLFPVAGAEEPASSFEYNIFFPDGKISSPNTVPELRIAFLNEEFSAECWKQANIQTLLEKLGILESGATDIAKALAKAPIDKVSEEPLWRFLLSAVTPMLDDEKAVMDWKDKNREFLTENVNVLCRDGAWHVARDVYAGRDWTGDDFLERVYGERTDRWFLAPPPSDPEERKQVERLARWLGVGWSPKVLPIINVEPKSEMRVRWQHSSFRVGNSPVLWQEHCRQLNADGENETRRARLRQDWKFDGDEAVLRIKGAFDTVVREWKSYKGYLKAVFCYSGNKQKDNDDKECSSRPSYLCYLMDHVAWIPVEGNDELAGAQDVFVKDSEVYRELRGWIFCPAVQVESDVAKEIGIRRAWSDVTKLDWRRWLENSLTLNPQDDNSHQDKIKRLYRRALLWKPQYGGNEQLWKEEIWCIEKKQDNTRIWHRESDHNNVYYVDRPDLERVRLEILKTFPVELEDLGRRADEVFGVPLLSDYLYGEPYFESEDASGFADKIRERLQERWKCLVAYLEVKKKDSLQPKQSLEEIDFYVGQGLRVNFRLNGQVAQPLSTPIFFQPKTEENAAALWIDTAENVGDKGEPRDIGIVWQEVGSALCYANGLSLEDGMIFETILSCCKESLKYRLRRLGITEATIDATISDALPGPQAPVLPRQSVQQLPETTPPTPTGGHRPAGGDGTGGGGHGGGGGGGENEAHRKLKDSLWKNPELIEEGMQRFKYEPDLASHYRPDLILKDAQERFVAVEIESGFPGENDYGVWQAVAYKHVFAAEQNLPCDQVRGMLVAPRIPEGIKQKCFSLGIEPVEVSCPTT